MADLECQQCGKSFRDYKSNNRKYCSWDCKKVASHIYYTHECLWCGCNFTNKKKNSQYCGLSCAGKNANNHIVNHRGGNKVGEEHHNWKGGSVHANGYKYISMGKKNSKRLEHRLAMENYLGRRLENNEHVHHINGDKVDNRIANLVVLTSSEHAKLHLQRRWHGGLA